MSVLDREAGKHRSSQGLPGHTNQRVKTGLLCITGRICWSPSQPTLPEHQAPYIYSENFLSLRRSRACACVYLCSSRAQRKWCFLQNTSYGLIFCPITISRPALDPKLEVTGSLYNNVEITHSPHPQSRVAISGRLFLSKIPYLEVCRV